MEILIDLVVEILEIVCEGCIEAPFMKKLPWSIRILCGVVDAILYIGIIGIIMYLAIKNESIALLMLDAFVVTIVLVAFWKKYKLMKFKRGSIENIRAEEPKKLRQ